MHPNNLFLEHGSNIRFPWILFWAKNFIQNYARTDNLQIHFRRPKGWKQLHYIIWGNDNKLQPYIILKTPIHILISQQFLGGVYNQKLFRSGTF